MAGVQLVDIQRTKIPQLREALQTRFQIEHDGIMVAQLLAHIDTLDAALEYLTQRIEFVLAPHAEIIELSVSTRLRGDRSMVYGMSERAHFTADEARAAGERIGIDWARSRFDVEQFRMGMDVELEHGTNDPETDVTDDDVSVTAKIARAHLNEFPDYYSRLAVMEAEAETYWAAQDE